MKFIMVKTADDRFLPLRQWRATHVKLDGNPIDVFFHALDQEAAALHLRRHFPTAYLHHEVHQ